MTTSGLTVWSISRRSILPSEQVAHDLDRASRRSRRAADEHQREEREEEQGRARARSPSIAYPVVVMIETVWKTPARIASSPSAIPYAPDHGRERRGGDERERDVQPELLVAHEHARPAADEPPVHEREVRAGEEHEDDDDPLGRRRERLDRPGLGREAAGRHRRERVGRAPRTSVIALVDAEPPERGEQQRLERGQADVEDPERPRGARGFAPRAARSPARAARTPSSGVRRRGVAAARRCARTMIPIPPSHWVNWRHIPSDRLIARRSR